MQEQNRVVRCYSEDTERPYFQIRYRLSLTGRDLLSDALNGTQYIPQRSGRTDSVCTTIQENGAYNTEIDTMMEEDSEHKTNRVSRSRSMEAPSDNAQIADLTAFSGQLPQTPRSSNRRSQQKKFIVDDTPMDLSDDHDQQNIRRTKSAGTYSELQLNRGAPPIPVDSLSGTDNHLKGLQAIYPQFASEFSGLITCLNSKNVAKYRVGQSYRKGVIIGIDEEQGKIVVFQKNMPVGTLVVMRTENPQKYEKGYAVQDIQGRMIGSVHAKDVKGRLIVVNTSHANANSLYNNQY